MMIPTTFDISMDRSLKLWLSRALGSLGSIRTPMPIRAHTTTTWSNRPSTMAWKMLPGTSPIRVSKIVGISPTTPSYVPSRGRLTPGRRMVASRVPTSMATAVVPK